VDGALIQIALVVAATTAIVVSPWGRRTLTEISRDGLMLRHARHLGHVMATVAILGAIAAALNVH
jgi:hypothetical protein